MEDSTCHSSDGEKPGKKLRHRKKLLYKTLLQQMEFYLSDANLRKDRFFSQLLQKDKYIGLDVFMECNKIRSLTSNVKDLIKAIGKSEILSLSPDCTKVCRTTPIQMKENEDDCTIYVEQLPPDAHHDWLKDIFSPYGKVEYVSIPKFKNGKNKGFGFVEFDSSESALRTLEAFGAAGCCLPSNLPPEQLWSIRTFETENMGTKENAPTRDEPEEMEVKEEFQEIAEDESDKRLLKDERTDEGTSKSKKRKRTEDSKSKTSLEEEDAEQTSAVGEGAPKNGHSRKRKVDNIESECDESETASSSKKVKVKTEKEVKVETEKEVEVETEEEVKVETEEEVKVKTEKEVKGKTEKEVKVKMEDTEKEDNGHYEDSSVHKKKRRKRIKKHKTSHMEVIAVGLQILPKKEWKRLRNKYLNLQREQMTRLKAQLYRYKGKYHGRAERSKNGRNGVQSIPEQAREEEQNSENCKQEEGASKPRVEFTPGVIVEVRLSEPVFAAKKFKAQAKSHSDVKYVDVEDGSHTAYIRCENADAAEKLVSLRPWEDMGVLEGVEEKKYWEKIKLDRAGKFEKKIRVKSRGKDKLLKKAEKALHIRFDDPDQG